MNLSNNGRIYRAEYDAEGDYPTIQVDATATNPNTMTPPFGLHRILTDKEIDLVTEYVHSL